MSTGATQGSGVARLSQNQADLAAGVLARAFQNDPALVYGIPEAAQRARILPAFMKTFVTYAVLFGEPYATVGETQAVALWLPLDDLNDDPARERQAGVDQIPSIMG